MNARDITAWPSTMGDAVARDTEGYGVDFSRCRRYPNQEDDGVVYERLPVTADFLEHWELSPAVLRRACRGRFTRTTAFADAFGRRR